MPTPVNKLVTHLDQLLTADQFSDYGPNGLQVESHGQVQRLATAATASLQAIEAAADANADTLLVHHGIFWGRTTVLTGMLGKRVRQLFAHHINLVAYHLPLDAHPEWGNNAWLLRAIGGSMDGTFGRAGGQAIGLRGTLPEPSSVAALAQQLQQIVQHDVIHCPAGPSTDSSAEQMISRIGVVTGGGQSFLTDAAAAGCELLITGETSEQTWHEAAELGIHCLAAGHHATENTAIHSLGQHLAEQFGLDHMRLDLPNPL